MASQYEFLVLTSKVEVENSAGRQLLKQTFGCDVVRQVASSSPRLFLFESQLQGRTVCAIVATKHEDALVIRYAATEPEHRNQGAMKALVKFLSQEARTLAVCSLQKVVGFWAACGFVATPNFIERYQGSVYMQKK